MIGTGLKILGFLIFLIGALWIGVQYSKEITTFVSSSTTFSISEQTVTPVTFDSITQWIEKISAILMIIGGVILMFLNIVKTWVETFQKKQKEKPTRPHKK